MTAKRPIPRGMREVRAKVKARRDHVEAMLRWIEGWDLPGECDLRNELAALDKRLTGFTSFCDGKCAP